MKFSRFFVLLLLLLTLTAQAQAATTYYVSKNGNNSNNGTAESTAFGTITHALSKVNDNDTIVVAAGTYQEATLSTDKSITLKSSGAVTLDGQNERRVIEITGGTVTIEGFTIKNGKASNISTNKTTGGGIYAYGCTLYVTNCRFENNYAENNGGGIYISSSSSSYASSIENCTFINNQANTNSDSYEGGGGIFVYDRSIVEITNCTFTGNTSNNQKSGALCVATTVGGDATVTVNYCTFATDSDKITMNKSNNITVKNSIIRAIVAGYEANISNITSADNIINTATLTSEDVKDGSVIKRCFVF